MGARTIHEAMEETYDKFIPRRSSAITIGVCFVIIITIVIILLAVVAFTVVLHYCTESDHGVAGSSANLSSIGEKLKEQNRILKILTLVSLATTRKTARVPTPFVWAVEKTSATFSCESDGQPLSSCLWAWNANSNRQRNLIIIDQEGIVKQGETPQGGIFHALGGLGSGKCAMQVEHVSLEHTGPWSCTLLSQTGEIFNGEVNVKEPEPLIYFTTAGEGVKSFTPRSFVVSTVKDDGDSLYGIAYDTVKNRLYWTSSVKIYRSEVGRTEVETVLSSQQYDQFRGLAFDWITTNVYAVTRGGFILACADNKANDTFACGTVLNSQGDLRGIALNPVDGTMYWSKYDSRKGGSIMKAGMDGSNPVRFVSGLVEPCGITLDFHGLKLFWADLKTKKIQSSDLYGREVITIAEVPIGPYGIAVLNDRLYWGYWDSKLVQSCSKTGAEIRKVYEGTASSRDFTVPTWNLPTNRTNHCDHPSCPNVCVLALVSFRCLS